MSTSDYHCANRDLRPSWITTYSVAFKRLLLPASAHGRANSVYCCPQPDYPLVNYDAISRANWYPPCLWAIRTMFPAAARRIPDVTRRATRYHQPQNQRRITLKSVGLSLVLGGRGATLLQLTRFTVFAKPRRQT